MSSSFSTFDFSSDAGWLALERNLYFGSSNAEDNARLLLKRKRKWYAANVDENYVWVEEPTSTQTYGTRVQEKEEEEAKKKQAQDEQQQKQQQQQQGSSPSNAGGAGAGTSTPPPSSSAPKSKYGVYISYIQLSLHVLAILNVLTYVLPLAGVDQQQPSFFRVMLLSMIAQAIYLVRQHGRPRWNGEYGRAVFQDEQSHFFFLSILLINAVPTLVLLMPFLSRSVVFVCGGLKQLLPAKVPAVWRLAARPVEAVVTRYQEIYAMNSLLEVAAGFLLVFNLFTAQRNFILLMSFGQYLRIRYMLSSDSKRAWSIVRVKLDGYTSLPMCPAIVRTAYAKVLSLLESWTDQEAMAASAAQPGAGIMSKCTVM